MPQIDFQAISLRTAAILTGSYVAATVITKAREYNQLVLYVDVTMGSLTSVELKVEFSNDNSDYYQESSETDSVAASVNSRQVSVMLHQFLVTGKYRLLIPIADDNVKVSVKGTGTVTSSSVKITGAKVKNYA